MIRPILLYGDEMLRETSMEVNKGSQLEIKSLISDMFETMHKANGIGLAAIQIGIPLRIFIIEAHLDQDNFHFRNVFINPAIKKEWGDLVKHPEGCLSVPGLTGLVERPSKIEIAYYNENWEPKVEVFDGYAARIIQHEYDHLEGVIYTDLLDRMWKKGLERPLELIENRQMEVPYSWK